MIYLDNAATTMKKPPEVVEAVSRALCSFGGPGRGVHEASLAASEALYDARVRTAEFLGAPDASRVAFAANATAALNTAIAGTLPVEGRALTTAASHNSVLRPLFKARDERGCAVDVASIRPDGSLDMREYERLLGLNPDIVAVTHVSNVTGDVYDAAAMARLAHDAGALFILDIAQSAGVMPVDQAALGADVICFTGHKSLLGPQGTGGLCVARDIEVAPFFEGGSGVHSFDERHPRFMPDALEAGTANAHGLAGLAAGVAYLQDKGIDAVAGEVSRLCARFLDGVRAMPGVRVVGGGSDARCAIAAIDVDGMEAAEASMRLSMEYGICTRAGAHCAPLMHKALGTQDGGVVRFSFSHLNADEEIDAALEALETIASER
ncbi:MAG: aminotransferase class V-fold PLP-dependent enzyme [Slackia faecicanis]|nr:aminotransferase class V-fold PLP-dependent enzyme [Slackia faecicanis]